MALTSDEEEFRRLFEKTYEEALACLKRAAMTDPEAARALADILKSRPQRLTNQERALKAIQARWQDYFPEFPEDRWDDEQIQP